MVFVYFSGHGDWLIEESNGGTSYAISLDKRKTHVQTGFVLGWYGYRPCDKVSGVFKLGKEDEEAYLITGRLPVIEKLYPCSHPNSAFSTMVEKELLKNEIIDRCHFLIVEKSRFGKTIRDHKNFIKLVTKEDTAYIKKPIPTETNPPPTKEPRIAVHKVIYRAFNSINKPVVDILPDDVMAVIKAEFDEWKENKVTRVFDVEGVINKIKGKEIYWHTPRKDIPPLTYANFCRKVKELKRKACGNG